LEHRVSFNGFDNIDDGLFLLLFREVEAAGRPLQTVDYFFPCQLLQNLSHGVFTGPDAAGYFLNTGLFIVFTFARKVNDGLNGSLASMTQHIGWLLSQKFSSTRRDFAH